MYSPDRPSFSKSSASALGRYRRREGFTLLELLVVLAIFGVMAAMAAPSMTEWRKNNALRNATREISQAFRYARSEAIARNATITVFSAGTTGDDWTGTITIFMDADGNGNQAFQSGDVNLKTINQNLAADIDIESNATAAAFVSFSSRGTLNEAGAAARFGVCDSRGNDNGYGVGVSNVGRVVTAKLNGAGSCDP
jgi:type IV fimbrial biogenesis protein FimT